MRRMIFFLLPILIIVAGGLTLFGIVQMRTEDDKQMDDLRLRAKALAQSLRLSAAPILESGDKRKAEDLVNEFERAVVLPGLAIYDANGKDLAVSRRFADWRRMPKTYMREVVGRRQPHAALEEFEGRSLFTYALPVQKPDGTLLGSVEVLY